MTEDGSFGAAEFLIGTMVATLTDEFFGVGEIVGQSATGTVGIVVPRVLAFAEKEPGAAKKSIRLEKLPRKKIVHGQVKNESFNPTVRET